MEVMRTLVMALLYLPWGSRNTRIGAFDSTATHEVNAFECGVDVAFPGVQIQNKYRSLSPI